MDYNKQALDFLQATGTEMIIEYSHEGDHFNDGKIRDIYNITLKRGKRDYSFTFGQSLFNSAKYVDKLNGNEFDLSGGCLKGNRRIVTKNINESEYIRDCCKKVKGTPPTEYDILSCLTKYDPGTFEDFCSEFGYDTDSRKAEQTYNAVKDEYKSLCTLYSDDEMEMLTEIQ